MKPALLSRLLLITALLCCTAAHAEIDWSALPHLSEKDREDILTLARDQGFGTSVSISMQTMIPGGGKLYTLRTPTRESGLRRLWREFHVYNIEEQHCQSETAQAGNWCIQRPVFNEERWHFAEDDWAIDVKLGTGISYAQARTIILAIRHQTLTSAPELANRQINASDITSISTIDPLAGEFSVHIHKGGTGNILYVRLLGETVELYSLLITIA